MNNGDDNHVHLIILNAYIITCRESLNNVYAVLSTFKFKGNCDRKVDNN